MRVTGAALSCFEEFASEEALMKELVLNVFSHPGFEKFNGILT